MAKKSSSKPGEQQAAGGHANSLLPMAWRLAAPLKVGEKEALLVIDIQGSQPAVLKPRPACNLSLILDRSGSMSQNLVVSEAVNSKMLMSQNPLFPQNSIGSCWPSHPINAPIIAHSADPASKVTKMQLAIEAAVASLDQLQEGDTVSVVTFDDVIQILLPATPIADKSLIEKHLRSITTRNSTNLFEGWRVGASELAKVVDPEKMNRALLFTDGEANVGLQNTDSIVSRVKELANMGISTSTFGMGASYNEDLLQAMAIAGNGNYYYLAQNDDFKKVFKQELNDLQSLVASNVLATISGVTVVEQLNGFAKAGDHTYALPNLVRHRATQVVCKVSWTDKLPSITLHLKGQANGKVWEVTHTQKLKTGEATAEACLVAQKFSLAKQRQEVADKIAKHDLTGAQTLLRAASAQAKAFGMQTDYADLMNTSATLVRGDVGSSRKQALFGAYTVNYSRDSK